MAGSYKPRELPPQQEVMRRAISRREKGKKSTSSAATLTSAPTPTAKPKES